MEIFEVFPIVSFRGMSTGMPIFWPRNRLKVAKTAARQISSSARGGLEPGFRVPASTIFHGIALEKR
jgi:hypothetical protein